MGSLRQERASFSWRRRAVIGATVIFSAAAFAVAGGISTSALAASKAPVKVMQITELTGPGATVLGPLYSGAGKTFEKWLNAKGGINGHPLDIIPCDTGESDPNLEVGCIRTAISDHVVAVVSSFISFDSNDIPLLAQAKIAYFGSTNNSFGLVQTSPDSFPIADGVLSTSVGPAAVAASECKNVGSIWTQGTYEPESVKLANRVLSNYGKKLITTVTVPYTQLDFSAPAAQATQGTDCILNVATEPAMLNAMKAAGDTQKVFGPQDSLTLQDVQPFSTLGGAALDDVAPVGSPSLAGFRAAVAKYGSLSASWVTSNPIAGAWGGLCGFANVAATVKGSLTNTTFLAAASKATNVSTCGFTPPINFSKPISGVPGVTRLFTDTEWVQQIQNGQEHVVSDFNFVAALHGKAKFVPYTSK